MYEGRADKTLSYDLGVFFRAARAAPMSSSPRCSCTRAGKVYSTVVVVAEEEEVVEVDIIEVCALVTGPCLVAHACGIFLHAQRRTHAHTLFTF